MPSYRDASIRLMVSEVFLTYGVVTKVVSDVVLS